MNNMNTNIALSYFNIGFLQDISEIYFTQIEKNMQDAEIIIIEEDDGNLNAFEGQKKQAYDFLSHPVILKEVSYQEDNTGEIVILPEITVI